MPKFAFVSDFDGTLTDKDFYQIIIDNYIKDEGTKLYKEWKQGKILDKDFLGYIYKSINRTEPEILEDILTIPLDPYAVSFIESLKKFNCDFYVLSAGTEYYIERLFKEKGIKDVTVFSNKGIFKDNGIHLQIDKNNEYYSERYGIDKEKVIKNIKNNYDKVFFAGDSEPDIKPALCADIVFAKDQLQGFLNKINVDFIPFNNFSTIERYLLENNIIGEM